MTEASVLCTGPVASWRLRTTLGPIASLEDERSHDQNEDCRERRNPMGHEAHSHTLSLLGFNDYPEGDTKQSDRDC